METIAARIFLRRDRLKSIYINMYNRTRGDMGSTLHYPRLDTVLMVEEKIKRARSYLSRVQLWKSLPKKVQYQTFCTILCYLANSRKIIFTKDRKIVWIFADSQKAMKLIAGSVRDGRKYTPEFRASLVRGLSDIRNGRTHSLGQVRKILGLKRK